MIINIGGCSVYSVGDLKVKHSKVLKMDRENLINLRNQIPPYKVDVEMDEKIYSVVHRSLVNLIDERLKNLER